MMKFAVFIVMIASLLTGSCSGRKNKQDSRYLIPEKDLVSILTDIHLADGLLAVPNIYSMYLPLDSITTYYQIIERHGYTKDLMDKTMKYYFVHNPKKLNKIYDQVLGILSEMESRVEKESLAASSHKASLWPGKDQYSIPSGPGTDSTVFDVTLTKAGYYSLTYSATLYPDDQTVNPRAYTYSCSADSVETGKRYYKNSAQYIKDGIPHDYIMTFTLPPDKSWHLRGWLYYYENYPQGADRHITISNISLTFSPMQI